MDGLNLTLAFDYEYVSDPPIFADIGTAKIGMTNWYMNFTDYLELVDDVWVDSISSINMGWKGKQPQPLFDGLSDFSGTVTSAAMVFQGAVLNRFGSLLSEGVMTDKINTLVNRLINMLPDYFEIKDSGLYLEGWFYESPIYRDDYMQLILKTTLQSEDQPWST